MGEALKASPRPLRMAPTSVRCAGHRLSRTLAAAVWALLAAMIYMALTVQAARAQTTLPPSAGCAAANAGAFDSLSLGLPEVNTFQNTFAAGETLTFAASGTVVSSEARDNTAVVTFMTPAPGDRTVPYVIPASGVRSFTTTVEGEVNMEVRCTPASPGTIIIEKKSMGGDGTFNFTGSLGGFDITTSNGTGSRTFADVSPGSYTVTEVTGSSEFMLTSIACGDPEGGVSGGNAMTHTANINLLSGATVVCTFANMTQEEMEQDTLATIKVFLYRRANLLLEEEPDRTRLFRRLPGSLWDGDGAVSFAGGPTFDRPMSLVLRGKDGETQIDFATSLSQLGRSMEAARRRKERDAMGGLQLDAADAGLISPTTTGYGFDVWVEGHYQTFKSDLGNVEQDGHLGVVYVGADYRVATSVIVGALVQFDWSEDSTEDTEIGVDGQGWMAGPYLSARLSEHLFFMVRGAWGQSDNTIDPFGSFTDKFDTNRWLVTANLAGNWTYGDFRVTPNLWLKYIEETQDNYVDSMGMAIPSQTVSLGRFSFGPEFGYRYNAADGTVFEPHGSITGIWDFDAPDSLTLTRVTGVGSNVAVIGTTVAGIDDFRAKVEGGVLIINPSGAKFRIVGTYDGIGSDDLEAIGAEAWLSFPLN